MATEWQLLRQRENKQITYVRFEKEETMLLLLAGTEFSIIEHLK